MPRHAKNNTASAFFTAQEKQKLEYGTVTKRIGSESFRNFDCCSLCLKVLQSPKACTKGHLFCKECIFENLLAQRKKIKRQQKAYKDYLANLQKRKELEDLDRQEKEIKAFDKLECGVLNTEEEARRQKIERSESEADQKSRETYSKQLTAFWVPALTPNVEEKMKKPNKNACCPAGKHPINLKQLVTVNYSSTDSKFSCPVCCKLFTNASTTILLTPCGHVVCKICWDKIVKDSCSCYVCQKGFTELEHIQLESGGTGFAAHHGEALQVTKLTPAAWV